MATLQRFRVAALFVLLALALVVLALQQPVAAFSLQLRPASVARTGAATAPRCSSSSVGIVSSSPVVVVEQHRRRQQQRRLQRPVSGIRLAAATVGGESGGGATAAAAAAATTTSTKGPSLLKVLWRFTRPHTFVGTALCIPALTLYAAPPGASLLAPRVLGAILWAMLPAGLINVYITGLNQVTDVEIDKINKPYLPIAAGQLSKAAASVVVVASLLVGLGLGLLPSAFGSQALLWVLLCSVALGTSYSLPPLRLKRFPVLAALCIIAVRGTVINMGFYGHALHAAFGRPESAASFSQSLAPLLKDAKCMAATLFFAVFGAVIALMKDVPDIKGDKLNNIKSFSVRAGAPRIFKLGKRLMVGLFLGASVLCLGAAQHAFAAAGGLAALKTAIPPMGAAAAAATAAGGGAPIWPFLTAGARAVIAGLALVSAREVQARAGAVDPKDGQQVYAYYMFLWRLFYLSYLALPLAR